MSYDTVSHDDAQTNHVCVYTRDVSRNCECDLLTRANPDLSFNESAGECSTCRSRRSLVCHCFRKRKTGIRHNRNYTLATLMKMYPRVICFYFELGIHATEKLPKREKSALLYRLSIITINHCRHRRHHQ